MKFRASIKRIIPLLFTAIILALMPSGFAAASSDYERLSPDELERLRTGDVVTQVWRDETQRDGAIDAYAAIHISATQQQVWAVMTSCELTLQVVRDMKICRVIDASADGRTDVREQYFNAPFPFGDFKTKFQTTFTPYSQIDIQGIGGDMKVQQGLWRIIPLGDDQLRVTYRARVKPKLPVPRFLLRRAVRKDTPQIMTALRDVSEALAIEAKTRRVSNVSEVVPPKQSPF